MSKAKWPATEADLAVPVVEWLTEQGWDVYQEVQTATGPIADIVATQGQLVWVVECKKAFGLAVLEQAEHWLPYAHYVSVAYPHVPSPRRGTLPLRVADWLGIGTLGVQKFGDFGGALSDFCFESRPPLLRREPPCLYLLRRQLNEAQRAYAPAGNAEGRFWSPFRATCDAVRAYVQQHPGAAMKEVVDSVRHHYRTDSTARSCLVKWAEEGKIRGVRLEREGRSVRLYAEVQP